MIITKDKIAQQVNDKINKRANKGIIKYGNTLDQVDMDDDSGLINLQEELLDGAMYIEKILWNRQKKKSSVN